MNNKGFIPRRVLGQFLYVAGVFGVAVFTLRAYYLLMDSWPGWILLSDRAVTVEARVISVDARAARATYAYETGGISFEGTGDIRSNLQLQPDSELAVRCLKRNPKMQQPLAAIHYRNPAVVAVSVLVLFLLGVTASIGAAVFGLLLGASTSGSTLKQAWQRIETRNAVLEQLMVLSFLLVFIGVALALVVCVAYRGPETLPLKAQCVGLACLWIGLFYCMSRYANRSASARIFPAARRRRVTSRERP